MPLRLMLASALALAAGAASLHLLPDAPAAERVASRAERLAGHPARVVPVACVPVPVVRSQAEI